MSVYMFQFTYITWQDNKSGKFSKNIQPQTVHMQTCIATMYKDVQKLS